MVPAHYRMEVLRLQYYGSHPELTGNEEVVMLIPDGMETPALSHGDHMSWLEHLRDGHEYDGAYYLDEDEGLWYCVGPGSELAAEL